MNRIRIELYLLLCLGVLSGCEMTPYRKTYILADQETIKEQKVILKEKEISLRQHKQSVKKISIADYLASFY